MCRWYTNYNEFIGAVAIFLTATAAVVIEHQETVDRLGPGRIGLALFSVFQARILNSVFFQILTHPSDAPMTSSPTQQQMTKHGKNRYDDAWQK